MFVCFCFGSLQTKAVFSPLEFLTNQGPSSCSCSVELTNNGCKINILFSFIMQLHGASRVSGSGAVTHLGFRNVSYLRCFKWNILGLVNLRFLLNHCVLRSFVIGSISKYREKYFYTTDTGFCISCWIKYCTFGLCSSGMYKRNFFFDTGLSLPVQIVTLYCCVVPRSC